MKLALLPLAPCCLASLAAAQQPLQPIDMFRLDYFMTAGAEDPVAWLDAEHYLVFDAGAQPRGPSNWSRVVARTGERRAYVDKASLARSLNAGEATAAIEDRSSWTWSEDHTRFVVNVGPHDGTAATHHSHGGGTVSTHVSSESI